MTPRNILPSAAFAVTLLTTIGTAQEWYEKEPQTAPDARSAHGMAFDPAADRTILFGGIAGQRGPVLGDTWSFDGADWSPLTTAGGPGPRHRFGMCQDPRRGRIVLFGGTAAAGDVFADTWSFAAGRWSTIATQHAPAARDGAALAYSAALDAIVLFGGRDIDGNPLDDTWTFDGQDWTRLATTNAPSARSGHVMTGLTASGEVLLFGGFDAASARFTRDTWIFDGFDWVERTTSIVPAPMSLASLSYREDHDVAILTGSTGAPSDPVRTFVFDGVDWIPGPAAVASLGGRVAHATAFDSRRRALVLFGGSTITFGGGIAREDTFELGVPAALTPFGIGCETGSGALELTGFPGFDVPAIGRHLGFRAAPVAAGAQTLLMIGTDATRFAGQPLPLSLAGFGMPGCELLVAIDDAVPMNFEAGTALVGFDLPLDPDLLGAQLFVQALTPAVATSNALRITIGS